MDDYPAIRRMKDGDIGGLAILVTRYQVRAVRAAFLITQDEALAEDIVHETFIRLYQRIHHFDDSRPFEPYLMSSVVRAALNAMRRNGKTTSFDADPAGLEDLLDQAPSVETQVELAQLGREVLVALSKLPARQRAAIVQRYYLELSEREMAQALEAAPGTVKRLLHSARARLRHLLGSERSVE
jgi:RNA polymerase sigma-70 factor (ECF subfamily)